jgi:hypothetical protein
VTRSPGAEAREILQLAKSWSTAAATVLSSVPETKNAARDLYDPVRSAVVSAQLCEMPVERIKDVTVGRLRIGPLRDAGYTTVGSVRGVTAMRLQMLPGVGEQTATQAIAAARAIEERLAESAVVRFDVDRRPAEQALLLRALWRFEQADDLVAPLQTEVEQLCS